MPADAGDAETTETTEAERVVLSSLDYDLADTAGGDTITITGTNLGGATSCTVGGVSATITANTPTSVTFTMPAKGGGSYSVQVTTTVGASNALSIEAWNPTNDGACTLLFDSVSHPYDATTGVWKPRYSVVANGNLYNETFATAHHLASNGAPVFDGDGVTEGGLVSETPGVFWEDYFGTPSAGQSAGSVAVIYKSKNSDAISLTSPFTNYGMAIGSMNAGSGTTGIGFGTEGGVSKVFAHMYNGAYRTNTVPAAADTMRAVVARWGTGNTSFDLSVDGSLSGDGYVSMPITGGQTAGYNSYPIYMGSHYSSTSVAHQRFQGTVRSFAILSAKASDEFITKFHEWAMVRHRSM